MASKYDSIWFALKATGSIKLAVPPALQKRVIKGVIHCKDHDLARKFELATIKRKEKITYTRETSLVTIKLTQYISTKDLQLGEL